MEHEGVETQTCQQHTSKTVQQEQTAMKIKVLEFFTCCNSVFVLSSTYSFKNFCCWFLKGIFVLFSNEDDGKESNIVLQFKPFSTQLKPTREKFVWSNHIFPFWWEEDLKQNKTKKGELE